jgi:hypothetical protein
MGVRVREKVEGSGEWWVFINYKGKRASMKIGSKEAAKTTRVKIEKEIKLERFNLETPEEMRPLSLAVRRTLDKATRRDELQAGDGPELPVCA